MKTHVISLSLLVSLSILPALAQTARPVAAPAAQRQQLNALVAQLKQTPDDEALREKIVRLAASMHPAPAIPEEARRLFVQASMLQKQAQTAADVAPAIDDYKQGLLLAPWWADGYYDLSSALELAGRYSDAIDMEKIYLASNPKDARQVQDHLYELQALEQKAAATQQARAQAAAEEQARLQAARQKQEQEEAQIRQQANAARQQQAMLEGLTGIWCDSLYYPDGLCAPSLHEITVHGHDFYMAKNHFWFNGKWNYPCSFDEWKGQIDGLKISGTWTKNYACAFANGILASGAFTGTIAADGSVIHFETDWTLPWGADTNNNVLSWKRETAPLDLIRARFQQK